MNAITEIAYWEDGYSQRPSITPSPAQNNENLCEEQLIGRINALGLAGKRVLEIGGGGSAVLARLALDNPAADFVCLDYSGSGCDLVRRFASEQAINNLNAVVSDFRDPPADMGLFDVVYSLGVVEHFTDLSDVLRTFSTYLNDGGVMVTQIPNMSGSLGFLTKMMDREVYEIHVPHDRESFREGHVSAGLRVASCEYLGSSNFGVLSSCVKPGQKLKWASYLWLSRLSKVGFVFERKFGRLPVTRTFSPYILAEARRT